MSDETKPPQDADSIRALSIALAAVHAVISAGVVVGFCFVIVGAGHGIGPLFWQLCHADLRSCVTWGSGSVLLASHLLTNRTLAAVLRLLALASLFVVWLVANMELKMFRDPAALFIVSITSAPLFVASLAELALDAVTFRTCPTRTITIRDLMVLTLMGVGFALPAALFK